MPFTSSSLVVPTTFSLVVPTTVLVASLSYIYWRFSRKGTNDKMPGPPGIPFFGNAFQLDPGHMHSQLEEWCWQYGPIYKVKMMFEEFVVITDPEAFNLVSKERPHKFGRSSKIVSTFTEEDVLGLFSDEKERWKHSRQWVAPVFFPVKVIKAKQTIIQQSLVLRERLMEQAKKHKAVYDKWFSANNQTNDKKYVDRVFYNPSDYASIWDEELGRHALSVVISYTFAYGKEEFIPDDLAKKYHTVNSVISDRMFAIFPTWRYFPTKKDREITKTISELKEIIDKVIASYKKDLEEGKKNEGRTLLESLLYDNIDDEESDVTRAAEKASKMTLDQIKGNLLQVIVAGFDTSANSMSNTMYLLACHPTVQSRFHDEVDSILGDLATSTDAKQLSDLIEGDPTTVFPYTHAIVRESMRLHTVAPINPAQTFEDVVINGHFLPKGTDIIMLPRVMGLKQCPTADPFTFRPERWLECTEEERRIMTQSFGTFFGGGPRVCPGRHLAVLEIMLFLVITASRFNILPMPMPPSASPATEGYYLTAKIENAHIRLVPRTSS